MSLNVQDDKARNKNMFEKDVAPCSLAEALTASIITAMMETVRVSETLDNFYQTRRRNIPEDTSSYSPQ